MSARWPEIDIVDDFTHSIASAIYMLRYMSTAAFRIFGYDSLEKVDLAVKTARTILLPISQYPGEFAANYHFQEGSAWSVLITRHGTPVP